jgi:hypothetical protein
LTLQERRECHDCSDDGEDENSDEHSPASVSHAESPSVGFAVQGKVFLSALLRDRQAFRGFVRVSILLCPPGEGPTPGGLKCAILSSRPMLVNYCGEYPWFSIHPADVFGEPSSRSPFSMQDPAGFSWRVERWLIPLPAQPLRDKLREGLTSVFTSLLGETAGKILPQSRNRPLISASELLPRPLPHRRHDRHLLDACPPGASGEVEGNLRG